MTNNEAIKNLEAIKKQFNKYGFTHAIDIAIKALEDRPQGEWLPNYTSQFRDPGRQCSLCGKVVEFSENYCPKCGAYMKGVKNG